MVTPIDHKKLTNDLYAITREIVFTGDAAKRQRLLQKYEQAHDKLRRTLYDFARQSDAPQLELRQKKRLE